VASGLESPRSSGGVEGVLRKTWLPACHLPFHYLFFFPQEVSQFKLDLSSQRLVPASPPQGWECLDEHLLNDSQRSD